MVVGGADTQLGLLGIGLTGPGRFTVVGGSFWQTTMLLDEPLVDPLARLRTLCHVTPGLWMMEGIGFYCGIVMRWFRDAFCELEQLQAKDEGVDVYAIMERKAEAVPPGANGVIGLFSNVMQANHWVHTSPGFLGFDVSNPGRAGRIECFRAIEESAAYVSLAHMRIIEELTRQYGDGGGPDWWSGKRPPVAANSGRYSGRPCAHPGGRGIHGTGRCDLCRRRSRFLEEHRGGGGRHRRVRPNGGAWLGGASQVP